MTTTKEATVREGVQGFRISCACKSHVRHGNAAFVPFDVATDRIHGWVLLANHPARMMREANLRKGVHAV